MASRTLAATALLAAVALAETARADDRDTCASASEDAQRLQRQGKLIDARQKFLTCSRSTCPAVVKQDCDAWLPTLEAMIPSLVIGARDEDGHDLVSVKVTLDGAATDTSSGRAVMVDPGVHKLHLEAPGKLPADQEVVVHEGERGRPVTVTLLAKDRPPPKVVPPSVGPVAPPPPPQISPFVYVLGTLAGVSLASFAVFEIKANTDAAHLKSTCAPGCPQSDVDSVSTLTVVANVSLVATGVFAGGAIALWLTGRSADATTPKTSLVLGPSRLALRGEF